MDEPCVTVVIPYFQRQAGVLRKALAGIAAQRECPLPIEVLIIDDSSPVAAEPEIAAIQWPSNTRVQLLRQDNAGPGSARNKGLDALPPATRYVAFLDSDDEWSADHLARGLKALEQGFDLYFANHYQLGQRVGAFERASRLKLEEHPALSDGVDLHEFRGDMFDQILRGNVIGTSTVLFRLNGFEKIRFRTDLTTAGEDYLFWMALAKSGARVTFSNQIEATYGRGVNVYSGAEWASDEYFTRVRHEIIFRKSISKLFAVDTSQKLHIKQSLKKLRIDFGSAWLHRLRQGHPIEAHRFFQYLRDDFLSVLSIPAALMKLVARRNSP